jgi:hypothetical protein
MMVARPLPFVDGSGFIIFSACHGISLALVGILTGWALGEAGCVFTFFFFFFFARCSFFSFSFPFLSLFFSSLLFFFFSMMHYVIAPRISCPLPFPHAPSSLVELVVRRSGRRKGNDEEHTLFFRLREPNPQKRREKKRKEKKKKRKEEEPTPHRIDRQTSQL